MMTIQATTIKKKIEQPIKSGDGTSHLDLSSFRVFTTNYPDGIVLRGNTILQFDRQELRGPDMVAVESPRQVLQVLQELRGPDMIAAPGYGGEKTTQLETLQIISSYNCNM